MITDDDDDRAEAVRECERRISACFSKVATILDDPEMATWLFRDFVKRIKLAREPRRRKPPSKRDAKLIRDYKAAKKGARAQVLSDFESEHTLTEGSALRIYRRHVQHSAEGVFREVLKQGNRKVTK